MNETTDAISASSSLVLLLSFVITWSIGLTPPVVIRYAALRRPMGKAAAIGTAFGFWLANVFLFTALGSQSKSHAALAIIGIVSYAILTRTMSKAELSRPESPTTPALPTEWELGEAEKKFCTSCFELLEGNESTCRYCGTATKPTKKDSGTLLY